MIATPRGLLASILTTAVVLQVLAGAPAAQADPATPEPAPAPHGRTTVTFTESCRSGNFLGEAQYTATLETSGGTGTWTSTVDRYRITRSNGQSGGNKANIDIHARATWNGIDVAKEKEAHSSDSMNQNGSWHNLGLSAVVSGVPLQSPQFKYDQMTSVIWTKFTFDKSGADPSCRTNIESKFGRHIEKTARYDRVPNLSDPIAYCIAISDGNTCTITKTDTKSSTIAAAAGFTYEWVSFNLSYSWTVSRAVAVSCTSPVMGAGDYFWAYPTGTRYLFTTYADFFGSRADVTPGSAFEVDGSVACERTSPTPPAAA